MKVISIGTGQNMFEKQSAARQRSMEYGQLFDEMHIIVFAPEKGLEQEKISEKVYLYPSNSKRRVLFIFDYLHIINKIIEERGRKDFIITVQDPFETGIIGLIAKLRYKLPLQVQIHTDFYNKFFILHSLLNFLRFFVAQVVLSFADSVRTVSARVAKSVGSLCENVDVLPIFTELRSTSSKAKVNTQDKVTFLTVARLEKEKDIETIIKAFAEVAKTQDNIELVIVGDGSERKSLEVLAKNLNLSDKVRFEGWSNNVQEFYAKAHAYVSSSLYEGYGMSVVEAALAGVPLVLSETGVAGEIFQNGEEAFVCKQKNVEQFAIAMKKLVENSGLRLEMGEKARKAVELIKIEQEEYLRRYKDLIAKAIEYHRVGRNIFSRNILLRYLVAGIVAASTNIFLLYAFTDLLNIWYLYSSILSFVLAFVLSFVLQKFWTFGDKAIQGIHHQLLKYLGVALVGILINTVFMYVLVDIARVWYIIAQIATGVIVAVFNFFAYKIFIFK